MRILGRFQGLHERLERMESRLAQALDSLPNRNRAALDLPDWDRVLSELQNRHGPDLQPILDGLADLQTRLSVLEDRPPPDLDSLRSDLTALQDGVTALADRSPPDLESAMRDVHGPILARLEQRLSACESRLEALGPDFQARLEDTLAPFLQRLDTLARDLALLTRDHTRQAQHRLAMEEALARKARDEAT